MSELTQRAWFLVEYLDLPTATGDPAAVWEPFQLAHLNNESLLAQARKTRQGGWSSLAAFEGVAEARLVPRSTTIFVSLNLEEATEKIRYARQAIEALDREVRPRLIIDNRLELELENGSRLISHPCTPPRGKARANLVLDEFAHYPREREIYTAAIPVITRGGRLRMGSSVLGASGLFWEIATQTLKKYPGYTRQYIPWWCVRSLCRNINAALKLAPLMLTEERVLRFGTPRLVEIFENLLLEDFQQEYECAWLDESSAWITWDEIKKNQLDAQDGQLLYWQANSVDTALGAIEALAGAIKEGKVEGALAAGFDVGRTHDLSEIVVVGKSQANRLPYRLGISLANAPFDSQFAVVNKALETLPITKLFIDRNGMGMQLAEQIHGKFHSRAEGVNFTNATKEVWAVGLKIEMQRGRVPLPLDRALSYQVHSIKKKLTDAKNAVFDTEANEKHHADKFWALALAVSASGVTSKVADYYSKKAAAMKKG